MRLGRTICILLALTALGAGDAHTQHLTKPWSEISNLSEDQKAQLLQIHRTARAQIQKILEQERRDSLSVLTQAQLNQLHDLEDQQTVNRKLAATQPAASTP
jgi:Spy/CpxP family protein refolding chaperone